MLKARCSEKSNRSLFLFHSAEGKNTYSRFQKCSFLFCLFGWMLWSPVFSLGGHPPQTSSAPGLWQRRRPTQSHEQRVPFISGLLGNSWLHGHHFCFAFAFVSALRYGANSQPPPAGLSQLLGSIWSWKCLGSLQIFSADMSQGSLESTKTYLQTEHITQVVGILQRSGAGVLKALGTSHV